MDKELIAAAGDGDLGTVRLCIQKGAKVDMIWYKQTALTQAIKYKHVTVIDFLLEKGANVNLTQNGLLPPLVEACRTKRLDIVQRLINKGANVNLMHRSKESPISEGARNGHLEIVKFLVLRRAIVNTINDSIYDSPLVQALWQNNYSIAEYLLTVGAVVNHRDLDGVTPLIYLAGSGNSQDALRFLLKKGADLNMCAKNGSTALTRAIESNEIENVQYLVNETNADVNKAGRDGMTPLACAAEGGNLGIVKLLIASGANINLCDSRGNTALKYVVAANRGEMVEYLLNFEGADVNKAGQTEIPLEVVPTRSLKSLGKFLIDKGSNIPANILLRYIQNENLDAVKFLVESGANVNKPNQGGTTPLCGAIRTKNIEMIRYLLTNRAHYSVHSSFRSAIDTGNLEIVRLLLEHGASVNSFDPEGGMPLIAAVELQQAELVRELLKAGADPNLLDKNGKAPLIVSLRIRNDEITQMLVENGAKPPKDPFLLMKYVEERHLGALQLCLENGASLDFVGEDGFTPLTRSTQKDDCKMVEFVVEQGADVNKVDANGNVPALLAAINSNFQILDFLIRNGAEYRQILDKLEDLAGGNIDLAAFLKTLNYENTSTKDSAAEKKNPAVQSGHEDVN